MESHTAKCQEILARLGDSLAREYLPTTEEPSTSGSVQTLNITTTESTLLASFVADARPGLMFAVDESPRELQRTTSFLNELARMRGVTQQWHLIASELTEPELTGTALSDLSQTIRSLLSESQNAFFVVGSAMLNSSVPGRNAWQRLHIQLAEGEQYGHANLISQLSQSGYERYEQTVEPGGFSVHGESIEIWAPLEPSSLLVTFLHDTIESIVVKSGRRSQRSQSTILSPVRFPDVTTPLQNLLKPRSVITHGASISEKYVLFETRALVADEQSPFEQPDPETAPTLIFYENHDRVSQYVEDHWTNSKIELQRSNLSQFAIDVATQDIRIVSEETLLPTAATPKPISRTYATSLIAELTEGAPAVHSDHGIGIYEGLQQRALEGTSREYLVLKYAGGDTLSVPVEYAHKVTSYIGETQPIIHRLHGTAWKTAKKQATRDAAAFARELLMTAGKRQSVSGHAYNISGELESTLETSFAHTLTPDQALAWEDIKADLTSPNPMDRLIVGDVGFGKTELAVRAARHVVANGKQVAVLAPTTLLVQQHYETFVQRLPEIKDGIGHLSRFSTAAEQKKVRSGIADGSIQIAIGTHALLSKATTWSNIGLIIIDEEQRFGVRQKEALKKLRVGTDILSLSATPIPRTLSMALSGLKDLSTISSPPQGRQSVTTHVQADTDDVLRTALTHELARGGQVFVVAPKIRKLGELTQRIIEAAPEARVATAHGQLPSRDLEQIMQKFAAGDIDVLVSSTIVESGLDVPQANTIIVTSATHFGLADLYQLRGRVGRRKVKAHAYFLYRQTHLTHDQRQRLAALVEASQLGTGWLLAQRDLEIRGAGNLLGAEQSGSVNAVGIQLYLDLVREASESDRETELRHHDVEITLPLPASLPIHYIADPHVRTRTYQELSRARTQQELTTLISQLVDRYGSLPPEAQNLTLLLELQHAAAAANIPRIEHQAITPHDEGPYDRLIVHAKDAPSVLAQVSVLGTWQVRDEALTWDVDAITPELLRKLISSLQKRS